MGRFIWGDMTAVQSAGVASQARVAFRRTGYVATIAVNLIMLYVANHVMEWGWPPFLTPDFERILWPVNLSFGASIVMNAFWVAYDAQWFRSFGQIGLNLIAGVAALRTYQVFPFEFSPYSIAWAPIVRFLLVLGIVGIAVGTVVEVVKLIRSGLQALD